MEITLKLNRYELHEAIRTGTLQALSDALANSNDTEIDKVKEALLAKRLGPALQTKAEEAIMPDDEITEAELSVTTEVATDPLPTIEEVRAALKAADEAGIEVKSFISAFGVKNLSAIPKERYPELLERLREVMEVHNG